MADLVLLVEKTDAVCTITLNRPQQRNAVDRELAQRLLEAFQEFENDEALRVAVLCGAGGHFCSGADLTTINDSERSLHVDPEGHGPGPLGPSRMQLKKPVIAAVSGYAVAGGLELSLLCDLRIAEESAVFGVFCRRWGVPLIDGGTVRLPRIVGQGRALDMILTGRPVSAQEALQIGLANRVVPDGTAREAAQVMAAEIARFPQECMLTDRSSVHRQWSESLPDALRHEGKAGFPIVDLEARAGAERFAGGAGRHGSFDI
jgi:enoyl-CoA hydratase